MDGTHPSDQSEKYRNIFPKVTPSNEIQLLIETEQPNKISTYLLTNVDLLRQQLNMLMPLVAEISITTKKTTDDLVILKDWKAKYDSVLPETVLLVDKHEKMINDHDILLKDVSKMVKDHHEKISSAMTIKEFILRCVIGSVSFGTTVIGAIAAWKTLL